jgi:hypothetical protein
MRSSTELFLFAAGLHLAALTVVAALVVMMFRADTTSDLRRPPDDGGDGRGGIEPRKPSRGPSVGGGPPLPVSVPARVRLREPGRLAELLPRPERRPAREPARPQRAPTRR